MKRTLIAVSALAILTGAVWSIFKPKPPPHNPFIHTQQNPPPIGLELRVQFLTSQVRSLEAPEPISAALNWYSMAWP